MIDKPIIYSELQEYYKKLPEKIRICIGEKCLSGKEIAEHIRKKDEIGKIIIRLHKLYRKLEEFEKMAKWSVKDL